MFLCNVIKLNSWVLAISLCFLVVAGKSYSFEEHVKFYNSEISKKKTPTKLKQYYDFVGSTKLF